MKLAKLAGSCVLCSSEVAVSAMRRKRAVGFFAVDALTTVIDVSNCPFADPVITSFGGAFVPTADTMRQSRAYNIWRAVQGVLHLAHHTTQQGVIRVILATAPDCWCVTYVGALNRKVAMITEPRGAHISCLGGVSCTAYTSPLFLSLGQLTM